MINKNQLKEIINDLLEVTKNVNISEETIFSEACSYQRGLMCGENKKIFLDNKNNPTEKQIFALKKLGRYKPNITKQEAFKIIKESKQN